MGQPRSGSGIVWVAVALAAAALAGCGDRAEVFDAPIARPVQSFGLTDRVADKLEFVHRICLAASVASGASAGVSRDRRSA